MLEDVAGIRKVVLACGAVDLRKGIDCPNRPCQTGRYGLQKGISLLFMNT